MAGLLERGGPDRRPGRAGQTAGQLRRASPVPRGVGGEQQTATPKPHLPAARCWKAAGTREAFSSDAERVLVVSAISLARKKSTFPY